MTISLVAVFIPVLFMGGIVGRLLHEFSVTIAVAILISGLRIADADADAGQPLPRNGPRRAARAVLQRSGRRIQGHDARLRAHADVRCAIASSRLLVAVAMLAGTVYLFITMPTGFIPSQDSGFHLRRWLWPARTSRSSRWRSHEHAVARIVRARSEHGSDVGAFVHGRQSRAFIFADAEAPRRAEASVDQMIERTAAEVLSRCRESWRFRRIRRPSR